MAVLQEIAGVQFFGAKFQKFFGCVSGIRFAVSFGVRLRAAGVRGQRTKRRLSSLARQTGFTKSRPDRAIRNSVSARIQNMAADTSDSRLRGPVLLIGLPSETQKPSKMSDCPRTSVVHCRTSKRQESSQMPLTRPIELRNFATDCACRYSCNMHKPS